MSLLDKIDQQTGGGKSAGQLELLIFRLHGPTLYGINVFKIKEILETPKISPVPKADKRIIGLLELRCQILPVIDMALALDLPPQKIDENASMLFMEFSRQQICFVIQDVERIAYINWEHIQLPPDIFSNTPYITAITTFEKKIVQVIDIERILADIIGSDVAIEDVAPHTQKLLKDYLILGVDDSRVARAHLKNTFEKLGVNYQLCKDGKEALEILNKLAQQPNELPLEERLLAVVSDIEMPEMDGYDLVMQMKKDPLLKNIPVILNSSISESVGENMAEKVGAYAFLTKWDATELVTTLETLADSKNDLIIRPLHE